MQGIAPHENALDGSRRLLDRWESVESVAQCCMRAHLKTLEHGKRWWCLCNALYKSHYEIYKVNIINYLGNIFSC
jgi:hypothetical protein